MIEGKFPTSLRNQLLGKFLFLRQKTVFPPDLRHKQINLFLFSFFGEPDYGRGISEGAHGGVVGQETRMGTRGEIGGNVGENP